MKLKLLLLFLGTLATSSKSEPLRIQQQNYNSQNFPQDGSANNFGNYYPNSEGISSTFQHQEITPTNDHGPFNSNHGSRNSIPNYRSNQGPTLEPSNSGYGSRGSDPSLGPVAQPGYHNYGSQGSVSGNRYNQGPINGQIPNLGSIDNAPTSGANYPAESIPEPRYPQDGSQAASGFGLNQGLPTRPEKSNYGSQGSIPGYRYNQGPINGQNPHSGFQDYTPTSESNFPGESSRGLRHPQDGSQAASGFGLNQGLPGSPEKSNYGSQGSIPGYRYNQGPINGQNPHSGFQDNAPTSRANYPEESTPEPRYPQDGSQAAPGFGLNHGLPGSPEKSNYGSRGSSPGFSSNQEPISGQNSHHGSQDNVPTFGPNYPTGPTRSRNPPNNFQAPSPGSGFNGGQLTEPENSGYGSQSSFPASKPSYDSEPTLQPGNSNDGFGSNQGPVARPPNPYDGSQGSSSNSRPTSWRGSNTWGSGRHGSRSSLPNTRYGWYSSTNPWTTSDGVDFSSAHFGSDVSSTQNFPIFWEVETLEDYDPNAVEKNAELFDRYRGRNRWKLRPLETGFDSNDDFRPQNVHLVFAGAAVDNSKSILHPTVNGENAVMYSFYELARPTIDDTVLTYNSNTRDAPIYIKPDPRKRVTSYIHNGKLIIRFSVRRVYS
ncbi:uncharacterized protein LOC130677386 [Microplitis mediator]|uniref:uncharacterized protein LOC130677386 n=1 Tax=Microplitis mediator TaxID=375433 RepID=UPI00255277E0|nr:uncharacterized protein LOC130677386 [Microplitis mediator]